MISAEYKSPISNSMVTCDLINEENKSYWVYRESGNLVSCSTSDSQRKALEWFAGVYQDFKPSFTMK